jgi:ATP-dependent Clp protease protease subunit
MSSLIVAQLLHLEAENPSKEISMYINSPGGVVTSGLSIYDTMQYIKPKVSTLVVGQAASMGSLLLTAGEKGMRFSPAQQPDHGAPALGRVPGSGDGYHDPRPGNPEAKDRLNEIYVKHTGQTFEAVVDALERDNFMDPEAGEGLGPDRRDRRKPQRRRRRRQLGYAMPARRSQPRHLVGARQYFAIVVRAGLF